MAAVYFTTIPCESYTVSGHIESYIFCEIRPVLTTLRMLGLFGGFYFKLRDKSLPFSKLHIRDHSLVEVLRVNTEELSFDSVSVSGPVQWSFSAESYQTEPRTYKVLLQLLVQVLDKIW